MLVLVLGLALFLGIHVLPTAPAARAEVRLKLGEGGYKALFSIVSLAGLVLIVWGFGLARHSGANVQLWTPPVWTKHIAFALMPFAFILLVAAYIPSNIRTRAKHPMLAAVKLWALAHLLANGDLAGLLVFASFLAWAVFDRISVKKRGDLGPLGAKRGGLGGDAAAVAVGLAFYVFMLFRGHAWLIGVPLVA